MITQKFDRSVSLLCWAYNEEDLILKYLERASKLMEESVIDYEIVLIDDCSHDRTNKIAQEYAKKNPHLKIYRNEKNMNVGYSCRRAIDLATKEYLFWQTIDWSYDITYLRECLAHLHEFDIVQGVRRAPSIIKSPIFRPLFSILKMFGISHLTSRSDNMKKALISITNYLLIRILFNVPVSDYQNITFYPTRWIQSLTLEGKSSFVNPEMIIKSYWSGMTFKEVSINFLPRKRGVAKGTSSQAIISSVTDIFKLWFLWIVLGKRGHINKGKVDRLAL